MQHSQPTTQGDSQPIKFYLAGQKAPPGSYLQVEGAREIQLEPDEPLPATLDGRVAVYVRRPETWADRSDHGEERS